MYVSSMQKLQESPQSCSALFSIAEKLEWEQPDSAIAVYRTAYGLALAQDSTELQGLARYYTSLVCMNQGRFDSAEHYLELAGEIFEQFDHREQSFKVLNARANNYQFSQKYEDALLAYQQAIELAEELDDPMSQARVLSNQSSVFNLTGRIESAIACLQRAQDLALPFGQTAILGDVYNNLANNYQASNAHDEAIEYTRKAAEIYHAVSDNRYEALALTNLAGLLHEKEPMDLEESEKCLTRSRELLDDLSAPNIEVNYWKHLAYYHYKKEQFRDAEKAADRCLEWLKVFSEVRSESTIYEILYSIQKAEGNTQAALAYHEKFFNIRDSLLYQDSRAQLQELEVKYQSSKKDSEISKQQLLISERTSQRNVLILGLFSSILLILFLVDRYRKNKKLAFEKVQNLERQQKLLVMNSMLDGQE